MEASAKNNLYRFAESLYSVKDKEKQKMAESATKIFMYGFETGINFAKSDVTSDQPVGQSMQEEAKTNAI